MLNILITGVNGYIGSKIAFDVLEKDNKVIGVDLNPSNGSALANKSNFKFIQADIINATTFPHGIEETDILIHCAALVHKRSSNLSRENYFRINYEGTKNVLNFFDKASLKHIIFLSTVSVYGGKSNAIVPDENTTVAPEDFYGESKLAAEGVVREFSKMHKIPHTIFRLTPVYGDFFLLNLNKRIYLPGKVSFYKIGSGDQRLSFVSVNNVVDVIVKSVNNSDFFNQTFIVKDMENYSINEMILTFKDIFSQHNKPIVQIPFCIPEAVFKLIGFIMPEKVKFYGYQLRKVASDAVYSGDKLHSRIKLKWNLRNTLKSNVEDETYF